MRIATLDATGLYYNSNDHLTSASVITDVAGLMVQKLDYLPFGSERVNEKVGGFQTRFTFTDQEKDDESGLMYYGARYYDPVIGRFTSVDPLGGNILDPQSLNDYSYVYNNPTNLMDSTGLGFETPWDVAMVIVDVGTFVSGAANTFMGELQGNETRVAKGMDTIRKATVDLAVDTAAACIPFVPAGFTKAVRYADEVKDVAKTADKIADGAKTVEKTAEMARTAEQATDAAKSAEKTVSNIRWSQVPKPTVTDKKLQNIIDDLYKPGSIGTGNTADAIRYEIATGNPVGNKWHSEKGMNAIRALEKWINKNKNSPDTKAATAVLNDLKDAFKKK